MLSANHHKNRISFPSEIAACLRAERGSLSEIAACLRAERVSLSEIAACLRAEGIFSINKPTKICYTVSVLCLLFIHICLSGGLFVTVSPLFGKMV